MTKAQEREILAGEMYSYQPGSNDVNEVMEKVGVRDTIDGGIDSKEEEDDISNEAEATSTC